MWFQGFVRPKAGQRVLKLSNMKRILFVEDEVELSLMIADCLRVYGFDVLTADTPGRALRAATNAMFSVIVLDVNLADLTGNDGCNLMVALKRRHPQTPIILYTGMAPEDLEVQDMLAQGAYLHVSKGDSIEVLLKAVRNASKAAVQEVVG
jgi:DNA-binding NtrC family response regulator